MKYRLKPLEIDAERFESENEAHRLGMWCGGTPAYDGDAVIGLDIPTDNGYTREVKRASIGDWIIQLPNGVFITCKDAVFAIAYEAATQMSSTTTASAEGKSKQATFQNRIAEPDGQESVITVWNDGESPTWKRWGAMDAEYAKADPGYVLTIPLREILEHTLFPG